MEAVADVERDQDVVEAVPHFSSGYIKLLNHGIFEYEIFEDTRKSASSLVHVGLE